MNLPRYAGPTMVSLIDGTLVFNDAEEWRHETECRHLLSMPLDARRAWLFELERMRGVEEVARIKATMTKLHGAKA